MNEAVPASWTIVPLGDVADVQLGKMLSAKARSGKGARPYLRNINIRWHRIDVSDVLEMDFDTREMEKYQLRSGDVLVCEGGEPGRAAIWKEQLPGALYQKALHRIRFPAGALEPRLFTHYLELTAATGGLARRFTGSTIKHLPREAFLNLDVPIPPLAEQSRIIAALEEHLSGVDAAVAGLERAQANVRRFRAAVQNEAVHGGASRWRWTSVGEHLTGIEAGASFKCEERPPLAGETGVVKVSAVTWGTYNEDQSKTTLSDDRVKERLLIRQGDFLFSRANTINLVGACVIAERVSRRVMLSDKILRLHFRDIDPRWALLVLRSSHGRGEIERLATGNQESMRNIGQERIRSIRMPLPSEEEQHRIITEVERRLAVSDRTAAEIDIQLARAKRLRQSILKRAFEGKLVTQDPTDEPASVLLERIRGGCAAAPSDRQRGQRPRA